MPPQILTGHSAGNVFTTTVIGIKEKIENKQGLLNAIADKVIFPALKRNWDNTNYKSHDGKAEKAITQRGAFGNVVKVDENSVTVTYDNTKVRHIDVLITGRPAVFPKKIGGVLIFNLQYKKNLVYRRSSASTTGKEIYYLNASDDNKILDTIEEWIVKDVS
jgi:hypothetical protein